MSVRFYHLLFLFGCTLLISCSSAIKQEDLYGEWNYVKVETPRNPDENVSSQELAIQQPSIKFSSDSTLVIMWGGKRLSDGKFRTEGKLIRYTENLEGGKTREFPFLVSKLTGEELVFETMEQNGTRVTAVKRK